VKAGVNQQLEKSFFYLLLITLFMFKIILKKFMCQKSTQLEPQAEARKVPEKDVKYTCLLNGFTFNMNIRINKRFLINA
jgi:hypothetical protein